MATTTDGLAKNNRDNVLFSSLLICLSVLRGWLVHVRVRASVRACVRACVRAFMCVLL